MVKELKKADAGRYTNADHVEFHKMMYEILDRYKEIIDAPAMLSDYRAKLTQETKFYKWSRSSEFTAKAKTDSEHDRILKGITNLLYAYEKHCDPSLCSSARHVQRLIDNLHGPEHFGYDAESAAVDSILAILNGSDYIPDVQALHLESWLTELARLNTLFKSYAAATEQEQGGKPDISFKTARRETDSAFRLLSRRITAIIELDGPEESLPLISEYNVHVNHYNTLVRRRYGRLHVRIDIVDGEIDPIEAQPYTGSEVFVIPSVRICREEKNGSVTVVKLVFGKDFTVGYKNNIAPGTATLIITGAGEYTGKIVTTFNIVEN